MPITEYYVALRNRKFCDDGYRIIGNIEPVFAVASAQNPMSAALKILREYSSDGKLFYLAVWNSESEYSDGKEPICEIFSPLAKKYEKGIKCPICESISKMSEKRALLKQKKILYYCSNDRCQNGFLINIDRV